MTQSTMTVVSNDQATKSTHKAKVAGAIAILSGLMALGILPRLTRAREAFAATKESPINHPTVTVVHAAKGQPTSDLLLPGNIEPLYSASIYARTEGYLRRRYVDIGSKVKAGQLLAEISSPEVDQQLAQARAGLAQSAAALEQAKAALQQARANEELARLTRDRDVPLGQQRAISQQIVDEAVQAYNARVADVAAATANITATEAGSAASQANVARLQQLQGFQRVLAPFDGVITERNVEQGDLITTGSASAGRPMFAIAQGGTLRIQIDVPQSQAMNVKEGQKASVTVGERVGRIYTGTVVRSADALNNAARTMRTEIQINNLDGSLLPGMYAEVKFTLPELQSSLIIPTASLVINQSGPHVALVKGNHTLHFANVVIGRDMGNEVEILSGLLPSDQLVASPSDLLEEGQLVQTR